MKYEDLARRYSVTKIQTYSRSGHLLPDDMVESIMADLRATKALPDATCPEIASIYARGVEAVHLVVHADHRNNIVTITHGDEAEMKALYLQALRLFGAGPR